MIKKSSLVRAAQTAATAVATKSPQAILTSLVIEAAGGTLRIIGTDLQVAVRATADFLGTLPRRTVSAKDFVERCRSLPDGDVSLTLDGSALIMKGGGRRFSVSTGSADDFPTLPPFDADGTTINAAGLAEVFARGAVSMSMDLTRPHLSGVMLHSENDSTTAITTDGRTMAMAKMKDEATPGRPIFVPQRGAQLIGKFIDGAESIVISVDGNGSHVVIARDNATMVARLGDSACEPLRSIARTMLTQFSESNKFIVRTSRAGLIDGVKAITAAAGEQQIACVIEAGRIRLVGLTTRGEESEDAIDAEITDERRASSSFASFTVSGDNLAMILNACDGDEVEIRINGDSNMEPVVIIGETFRGIVMPIRAEHYDAFVKRVRAA